MEAPTTLGWGSFPSDRASGRVLSQGREETCGLCQLAIWSVLGRRSLSSGRSSLRPHSPPKAGSPQGALLKAISINNLLADESSSYFLASPGDGNHPGIREWRAQGLPTKGQAAPGQEQPLTPVKCATAQDWKPPFASPRRPAGDLSGAERPVGLISRSSSYAAACTAANDHPSPG